MLETSGPSIKVFSAFAQHAVLLRMHNANVCAHTAQDDACKADTYVRTVVHQMSGHVIQNAHRQHTYTHADKYNMVRVGQLTCT